MSSVSHLFLPHPTTPNIMDNKFPAIPSDIIPHTMEVEIEPTETQSSDERLTLTLQVEESPIDLPSVAEEQVRCSTDHDEDGPSAPNMIDSAQVDGNEPPATTVAKTDVENLSQFTVRASQSTCPMQDLLAVPDDPSATNVAKTGVENLSQFTELASQNTCTMEDLLAVPDDSESSSDARPESLKKLIKIARLLRNLNNLGPEEMSAYNIQRSDQIKMNERLQTCLEDLFEIALSTPGRSQAKLYNKHIAYCFRKIYFLQFLDLPGRWKDTINGATNKYLETLVMECITSEEPNNIPACECAVNRLNLLLLGPCRTPQEPTDEECRLSLLNLKMLHKILDLVLPVDRVFDVKYFNQLHESILFYDLAKTTINVWKMKREFVEHERPQMIELLKQTDDMIVDRNFYIHEKCPLVQIELTDILVNLRVLTEIVEKS